MFRSNDYLEDAIFKKNIARIRNEFSVICQEDPSFSTGKFDQTLEYVKSKNINGFLAAFDGGTFEPKEKWNEDYWALVVYSLIDNFCIERINHLKQVSKYLYPPKQTVNASNTQNSSKKYEYTQPEGEKIPKKMLPTVITIGLAVTCVTALAVGAKGAAVITGVSAIAAGIYTKQKN